MKASEDRRKGRRARASRGPAIGEAAALVRARVTLALLTLAVVAATVLVYRPVLTAQAASFDDEEAIVRNQLVRNPSWDSVRRFFSEVTLSSVVRGYYRPLTLTSLMLDSAMGAEPDDLRVYHRTSLALHVGSTALLILLCYQLFGQPWIAAAVGLLFGLHPMTVEPVAWVMERKTVLAAFFAFAAVNAYARYTRAGTMRWYVGAIVLFLMSLLAKPTGTPLPLMLLLMDYWPLRRFSRRAVIEKWPFFLLAGLFALLCVVCEQKVNPLTMPAKLSPLHLPLRLCWLTAFYPGKILLPIRLSSVYMLPYPLALTNPIVIAAVAATGALIVAVVLSARRTPAIWTGTLMFYIGLAPTMGFVGYSWVSASDKYVYLPAFGLAIVLAWALERATTGGAERTRRARRAMIALAVLMAAGLLGAGTHRYLQKWQTTQGFLAYMLELAPNSPHLHCQMGRFHLDRGENEQSIEHYTTALSFHPTNPDALNNRGLAYLALGRYEGALEDLSKVVELRPNDADAHYNRGMTWSAKGDYARAIRDFDKAIQLLPTWASAYNNRGVAYTNMGQHDRALEDHVKAIELEPGSAMLYNNRAVDYYRLKEYDKAWADIERCRKLGGTPSPQLVALLEQASGRTEKKGI